MTAIILALAAVGLGRMAWFHLAVEPRFPHPPPIDDRYRAARGLLPRSGTIGYVSDRRVARTPAEYETSTGTAVLHQAEVNVFVPPGQRGSGMPAFCSIIEKLCAVADTGRGVVVSRRRAP